MNNKEVAERIVERMLETIKKEGHLPWTKPWTDAKGKLSADGYTEITLTPKYWSRHGRPYDGINLLILAMTGYEGEFITFKQCQSEGGRVKKGEKATTVVFWTQYVKDEEVTDPKTGQKITEKKVIPVLKTFNVFHISQCEGLTAKNKPKDIIIRIPKTTWKPADFNGQDDRLIQSAEDLIYSYVTRQKTLTFQRDSYSDRACYTPALDRVTVPNSLQFKQIEEFYSTTLHELGHSTGHSSRLNRNIMNSFGNEDYSREELVAEITSASLLSILGLESGNTFRNSTAYIESWSSHIKKDPMMFVTASSRASKAVNFILGVEEEQEKKVA